VCLIAVLFLVVIASGSYTKGMTPRPCWPFSVTELATKPIELIPPPGYLSHDIPAAAPVSQWTAHDSDRSGRTYWSNPVTGESTWVNPDVIAAPSPPPAYPTSVPKEGDNGCCNTSPEPNCGSKTIWGGLCALSLVGGLIMFGLSMEMGGCECDDVCGRMSGGSCAEWFGGCSSKGNYKKDECVNYLGSNSCTAGAMPASSGCQFGPALPFGAAFGMFWLGLLFLILMCVFCCGVMARCRFKGGDKKMGVAPPHAVVVHGQVLVHSTPAGA